MDWHLISFRALHLLAGFTAFSGCATAPSNIERSVATAEGIREQPCIDRSTEEAKRECRLLESQEGVTLGVTIAAIDALLMNEAIGKQLAKINPRAITERKLTDTGKSIVGAFSGTGAVFILPRMLGFDVNPRYYKSGLISVGIGAAISSSTPDRWSTGIVIRHAVANPSPREQVKSQIADLIPILADLFVLTETKKLALEKKMIDAILEQSRRGVKKDFKFDAFEFMRVEGFVESSQLEAFERVATEIRNARVPEIDPHDPGALKRAYAAHLPLLRQIREQLRPILAGVGPSAEAAKLPSVERLRRLDNLIAASIVRIEANLKMI